MLIANFRLLEKVFAYFMLGRTEDMFEATQPEEQHCFGQGRRIEEQFLTINVLLQKILAAYAFFFFFDRPESFKSIRQN